MERMRAGLHPGGEGVPFLLQLALAGGVEGDPGGGRLTEPVLVFCPGLRGDGGFAGVAGGFRGLVQREQRVGPLVPLNNPVRLAEELAMLHTRTAGRAEVLFLRGTPNEHKTYDTDSGATRAMTQEGIDLVLKAWSESQPFEWHGEHYNFSNVSVWPHVGTDRPRVFGSGNSEESILFAAERRLGIGFSFAPPEKVADWISLYRKECARAGWAATPDLICYRGLTYIADTDEQAQVEAMAFFGAKLAEQAQFTSATLGGPPVNDLITMPYFFGAPGTAISAFELLRDVGVGFVDICLGMGTAQQQTHAVELLGREVLPVVHSWENIFPEN
jgi:alkanesulfonate monooxygenase SsuD/methylene tetrahydromethanopterin reductase-like flavin-dependent oxidoreductase (luciferase family)